MYSLQQCYVQHWFKCSVVELEIQRNGISYSSACSCVCPWTLSIWVSVLYLTDLLFVLGVNCSDIVGKENCDRICENGTCVQGSPGSFRCICDTGSSGKQLLFSRPFVQYRWIVCDFDNENIIFECSHAALIPDRWIIDSWSVFHDAIYKRQRERFCCIPALYAQPCHLPPRGNYLWKRSKLETTKAIYLQKISISLWALNLIPLDVIFVIIIYEVATWNQIPHVTTGDMRL